MLSSCISYIPAPINLYTNPASSQSLGTEQPHSLKRVSLVVLGVAFLQMVKTGEQQNFLSDNVETAENLDFPKMPYINLLALVLAAVEALSPVSRANQAWERIFKFVTNSGQLWWLQELFTGFLRNVQSYFIPANLLLKTLSSPCTFGQWLTEVLLRKRIWKELLRLLIHGSTKTHSQPLLPLQWRKIVLGSALPWFQAAWRILKTCTYHAGKHHQLPESAGLMGGPETQKTASRKMLSLVTQNKGYVRQNTPC